MEDDDATEQSEDMDTPMNDADAVPHAPEEGVLKGHDSQIVESNSHLAAAVTKNAAEQEGAAGS